MRVNVKHLHVGQLGGLILLDHGVGDARGGHAVGITQRQIQSLHQRKASAGVGKAAHAEVGNALDHALVALVGLGERAGGIDRDLHPAAGALLDFIRPVRGRDALHVRRREEDAVGKLDHFRRLGGLGGLAVSGGFAGGQAHTGEQRCARRHGPWFHVHKNCVQGLVVFQRPMPSLVCSGLAPHHCDLIAQSAGGPQQLFRRCAVPAILWFRNPPALLSL